MVQSVKQRAGIILHPSSLPNGVLDDDVFRFIDWMHDAGLSIWQVLPLTPPADGLSPYQCDSAFALNSDLLPNGFDHSIDQTEFEQYLANESHWLNDYALFQVLKTQYPDQSWNEWPTAYRYRYPESLRHLHQMHRDQIRSIKKKQYALQKRWQQIKSYANARGILVFGDMPIFVNYNSADVWVNTSQFLLNDQLMPDVVTGVPPDYFSQYGQLWGDPHYDWETMIEDDFQWWRRRISRALECFDLLRIDHFRGLESVWQVSSDQPDARNGQWVKVPGDKLLTRLSQQFPDMPFIAEDLGIITDEVVQLKRAFSLPGMSVLQFGFDGHPDNPHALTNQIDDSVVYTGTHDNDTTVGWFNDLDQASQTMVLETIDRYADNQQIPWGLIQAAMNSPARYAIVPLQDFLSLDSQARMNTPGTIENNWRWRFSWGEIPEHLSQKIYRLINDTNRLIYNR